GVAPLVRRGFALRGGSAAEAEAALPHYIRVYEANATRHSRAYPGVRATLAVLHGLGLADLFDGVAGGDRFAVRKPDPGHLTGLVGELGGEVARAALVGDSEIDAAAAHAAGM